MKRALVFNLLGIFSLVSPSLFSMEKPSEHRQISAPEVFPIQRLPTDLKAYLLTFLIVGKGKTRAAKLHNAAEDLRNCMMLNKSFAQMLSDERANKHLVEYLSRYTGGNLTQAGLALATLGARKYLNSLFCERNRWCFPIEQEINWAAAQGDDVALKALISSNRNLIPAKARCCAASAGHLSTIELLYAQGISVPHGESDQLPPLIFACRNGHTAVVQKLLEMGENPCHVSPKWKDSCTALFMAAEWGHLECVNLLLATKARSQVDFRDRYGRTALMMACQRGFVSVMRALLAAGALVNLQDDLSSNALSHAVGTDCSSADYITIVQDLLAAGAAVNVPDVEGKTALFQARRNPGNSPHKKVIEKLLLQHGAVE